MKRISLFLALLSIASTIFISNSCKKDSSDPEGTRLQVFVKQAASTGPYKGQAQVKLYLNSHARDIDSVAAVAYTDSLNPSTIGAIFENLLPQKYYLKTSFTTGIDQYLGFADTVIELNKTTNCEIIALKYIPNGNLRVYVKYNNIYFTAAIVKLFLSDADRTSDNVYLAANTEDHGGSASDIYATFDNLPFGKYYIKATYNDTGSSDFYIGTEDNGTGVTVPKGATISYFVKTTKQ